jgi:hypothetical protein
LNISRLKLTDWINSACAGHRDAAETDPALCLPSRRWDRSVERCLAQLRREGASPEDIDGMKLLLEVLTGKYQAERPTLH